MYVYSWFIYSITLILGSILDICYVSSLQKPVKIYALVEFTF